MKQSKVFFLAAILSLFSFSAFANTNTDPDIAKVKLQNQVKELIVDADFWTEEDLGSEIMLKFMVTVDKEIIVLSTKSGDYEHSLKQLLNYKKVDVDNSLVNGIYLLPIKVRR